MWLKELENDYARIEIVRSEPIVSYRESIIAKSSQVWLAKSTNKHNRLWGTAEPLSNEFVTGVEGGKINPKEEPKLLQRKLIDTYGFDNVEAKKLWWFGP